MRLSCDRNEHGCQATVDRAYSSNALLVRLLRWVLWSVALLTVGAVVVTSSLTWGLIYLWLLGAFAAAAAGLSFRRRRAP